MAEEYAFAFNEESVEGMCGKCLTLFERPERVPQDHPGFLCPVCKKKGMSVVGVVSFKPDIELNVLPPEVPTA